MMHQASLLTTTIPFERQPSHLADRVYVQGSLHTDSSLNAQYGSTPPRLYRSPVTEGILHQVYRAHYSRAASIPGIRGASSPCYGSYGYTVPATSGTSAPTSPTSQANDSKSSDSSVLHRQVSHRVEPTTAEFTGSKYTNSVSRE